MEAQLVNAGWSVTGGTGNWTITSATTSQGLGVRITISNPGGGANCAKIIVKNPASSLTGTTAMFLLPDSTTWRIIANPYQFFVMKDSSPSASKRDFASVGCCYIPTFLSTTECIWWSGHCLSDISSASVRSFRTSLTNDGVNSNTGAYGTMLNGTMFNAGTFENGIGTMRFRIGAGGYSGATSVAAGACEIFTDGTIFMDTPYICWGPSGTSVLARANGILWDSVLVEGVYNYGDTKTFDSKNWMAITHANVGNGTDSIIPGTLFTRIT